MSGAWRVVVEASIFWAVVGVMIGWAAVRVPDAWLTHDSWLTRIRPVEDDGRTYQRTLRVQRWKDRLPEGGAIFSSGRSKRSLARGNRSEALEQFAIETRRAEWVHWFHLGLAPTFAWWQPANVSIAMVLVITAAHTPFIVVQRYNRARVLRILQRNQRGPNAVRSSPAVGFLPS